MAATERIVRLAGETDLEGFRRAARALLAEAVPPEQVSWVGAEGMLDWSAAPSGAERAGSPRGRSRRPGGRCARWRPWRS